MIQWLSTAISTVALLAGAGAALYFTSTRPLPGPAAPDAATGSVRAAIEQCAEAAQIVHDVRWAAACMVLAEQDRARHAACLENPDIIGNPKLSKAYCDRTFAQSDGSADCTLPDERAASLLALLTAAEQRCAVEPRVARP
jgi:hypothetical protein